MEKPKNFVFIGRSGAGKDTQISMLQKSVPNLFRVGTGDLMRALAKQPTDAGIRVKTVLENGGLMNDDIAVMLWTSAIAHGLLPGQGLVCDGFPRRLLEAQSLDRFLEWLDRKEDAKIIYIDVSREEAFRRLKARAREDDTDDRIQSRLDWFEKDTQPVIDYYANQHRLIDINGEQSVEAVAQEIFSKI